jgi:spore germination cell wall hydrolase CwlJ-like protein
MKKVLIQAVGASMLVSVIIIVVCTTNVRSRGDHSFAENIVARTLLCEAGSNSLAGMYAVACVIQQRMIERCLDPVQVCLQKKQFSCWNRATDSDRRYKPVPDSSSGKYAKELAALIVNGSPLNRSVVDFADSYCGTDRTPAWATEAKLVAQIGGHKFFKQ